MKPFIFNAATNRLVEAPSMEKPKEWIDGKMNKYYHTELFAYQTHLSSLQELSAEKMIGLVDGNTYFEGKDFSIGYENYYWEGGWKECSKDVYESYPVKDRRLIALPVQPEITPVEKNKSGSDSYWQRRCQGFDIILERLKIILSSKSFGEHSFSWYKEQLSEAVANYEALIQSSPEGNEAAEFAEWVDKNFVGVYNGRELLYWKVPTQMSEDDKEYTTDQLYQTFKTQSQK